jgi:Fe-S cluster assembly iron-binding protein IscA
VLIVTGAASAALAALIESPGVPEGAVPRLAQGHGPDGEPAVGLTLVSEPDPRDDVIAVGEGVDVFVDAEAADALEDQQLDVEMDGERVAFSLRRQGRHGGPPGGSAEDP